MTFVSDFAAMCHEAGERLGASWDYPSYTPHLTLSYEPQGVMPMRPPTFAIAVGPEYAEALDEEAYSPTKASSRDEEPTEAELADAMALAEALIDDGLLEAELVSPLRDVVAHFGQRVVRGSKGDLAPELKAITDPGSPAIAEFVAGLRERAGMIGDTTRAKLADAIARAKRAGGSLITAIRTVFGGFNPSRVETIAATEAVRAAAMGTQLGMSQAGIRFKTWVTQSDERVRGQHRELEGQIVRVDEPFRYRELRAMGPSSWGTPDMDCGCRCAALPFDEGKKAIDDRDARWHAYDAELQHHEAMVREAVAQGFAAQERRAAVRLAERGSGAAA